MIRILGKKKVAKRIFWVLAIIIVPSFMIWGVGEEIRGGREQYLAARVNRENITRDRYYQHLQELIRQRRQFREEELAEDDPLMQRLQEDALEDLIRNTLLLQEARRNRLRVTDRELTEAIKQDPAFQDEDGRFDPKRFREIAQMVPEEEWLRIEENIRKQMLLQKLHQLITASVKEEITEEDIVAYREELELEEDAIAADQLREFLGYQKAREKFSTWYQELREQANIKIYLE